jgi:hypothetical protein
MNDTFEQLVRDKFQYLETMHRCQVIDVEKTNYGCIVWYKNNNVAIRISYEIYEDGVFVTIYKLHANGQIPENPIFFDPNAAFLVFDLNDLMRAQGADRLSKGSEGMYDKTALEETVENYANALKSHATDIINGDFNILPRVREVVVRRAKELEDER